MAARRAVNQLPLFRPPKPPEPSAEERRKLDEQVADYDYWVPPPKPAAAADCCGHCLHWCLGLPGHAGHHSCERGHPEAEPGYHCAQFEFWIKGPVKIYVDDLVEWGAPGAYRGKDAEQAERVGARHGHRWCHMFADKADCPELHAFARKLGLKREWFQHGNHYDLTPTKRDRAVKLGAVETDRRTSVAIWKRQREAEKCHTPSPRATASQ